MLVGPTTITAQGGGVTGYYDVNNGNGYPGGSGGGGGYPGMPGGTGNQPTLNPGRRFSSIWKPWWTDEGTRRKFSLHDYGGGGGAGQQGADGNGPATPSPRLWCRW